MSSSCGGGKGVRSHPDGQPRAPIRTRPSTEVWTGGAASKGKTGVVIQPDCLLRLTPRRGGGVRAHRRSPSPPPHRNGQCFVARVPSAALPGPSSLALPAAPSPCARPYVVHPRFWRGCRSFAAPPRQFSCPPPPSLPLSPPPLLPRSLSRALPHASHRHGAPPVWRGLYAAASAVRGSTAADGHRGGRGGRHRHRYCRGRRCRRRRRRRFGSCARDG